MSRAGAPEVLSPGLDAGQCELSEVCVADPGAFSLPAWWRQPPHNSGRPHTAPPCPSCAPWDLDSLLSPAPFGLLPVHGTQSFLSLTSESLDTSEPAPRMPTAQLRAASPSELKVCACGAGKGPRPEASTAVRGGHLAPWAGESVPRGGSLPTAGAQDRDHGGELCLLQNTRPSSCSRSPAVSHTGRRTG